MQYIKGNELNGMFYQKNGQVIIRLARDIFVMEPGDRLPPIGAYAEALSMGRGTVQIALNFLLEKQCITLEIRGRNGSFLTAIDRKRLWEYTDWDLVLGAGPVPSKGYQGYFPALTTAIYTCLTQSQAPFNLVFSIASHNRLDGLEKNHYSFVITTKLAFNLSCQRYPDLETALELPGCTYSSPYLLAYHRGEDGDMRPGKRIAVNVRSAEQNYLSDLLCQKYGIEKVEMIHQESLYAFLEHRVDLILVRGEMIPPALQKECDTASISYLGCDADTILPVLVVNRENYKMGELIRRLIDPEQVKELERQVLCGEREEFFY